jgi:hypothetical protein
MEESNTRTRQCHLEGKNTTHKNCFLRVLSLASQPQGKVRVGERCAPSCAANTLQKTTTNCHKMLFLVLFPTMFSAQHSAEHKHALLSKPHRKGRSTRLAKLHRQKVRNCCPQETLIAANEYGGHHINIMSGISPLYSHKQGTAYALTSIAGGQMVLSAHFHLLFSAYQNRWHVMI